MVEGEHRKLKELLPWNFEITAFVIIEDGSMLYSYEVVLGDVEFEFLCAAEKISNGSVVIKNVKAMMRPFGEYKCVEVE